MARRPGKKLGFTQADVDNPPAHGKIFFGAGLYLQNSGPNARSWILRYSLDGKPRYHGLGSASILSLEKAKKKAETVRFRIRIDHEDPVKEREETRSAKRSDRRSRKTFRRAAAEFLAAHEPNWKNEKHRDQWSSTLETYVFPVIGKLPVHEIKRAHIVDVLRPIWLTKRETARRVRGRIEQILGYGIDPHDETWRNPAEANHQLKNLLGKPPKKQVKHHRPLPFKELPAFFAHLQKHSGVDSLALQFLILTAARTTEVRGAEWREFNEAEKLWLAPGSRMKAGRAHRVPLSNAAIAVLEQARKIRHSEHLVFPGRDASGWLSENTMLALLKRMAVDATVHGFRGSFSSWRAANQKYAEELAEAALAHEIPDEVKRAYQQDDLLDARRPLMEDWAAYCLSAGKAGG